ncbi:MAG: AmpG family muropeptide MFS transporter [Gammaproteobacteria bacterium]|nr:AmpG family muropeptide MFS transporter [Gammaproteobacteria bacterium]MCW8983325.1 AmpG family muropeptide MFS transporter [Gammaproteobacteria bacterium]
MGVAFVMGFACGLPLLLTGSVLQAWMREDGVDLSVIGLFALVGLPYTLKFIWAPVLDRFTLPFLGRRRGWMLLAQISLMVSIIWLGFSNPAEDPWLLAGIAFLVTFFSASQDIVVDAYRREDLKDNELGLGSSLYVNGYRIGMLLAGSGGLILADIFDFQMVYLLMALSMLVGVVATLLAKEPDEPEGTPINIREAVVDPFIEYFSRPEAVLILAFILFYKLGDTMAASMTTPFYLDMGYSKSEIGAVAKLFGFWATIIGGLLGGFLILRWGINRSLWIFGGLQAISTAGFAILVWVGHELDWLAAVIAFENLSGGMGTAAYVAFMASITNKKFTATQYALLTSLMGIPRVIASAPTGFLVEAVGWAEFFIICAVIALPGLMLLQRFAPWQSLGEDQREGQ